MILANDTRLQNVPIMSLHMGGKVATTKRAVINPANLRVYAYEIIGNKSKQEFLLTSDIREFGNLGFIIDNSDHFVSKGDVVKLDHILDTNFNLLGINVKDTSGRKIGKVSGYTIDTAKFEIQQLSVKQGILKRITDTGSLIHRNQIVEISDDYITVKQATVSAVDPVMEAPRSTFTNPFRSQPQPSQADSSSTTSP